MAQGRQPGKKKSSEPGLSTSILSWSLTDILNEKLYSNTVESIPETFSSVDQYYKSFRVPLLEETRADLCSNMELISQAPVFTVLSLRAINPKKYSVKISPLGGTEGPMTRDILALSSVRPRKVGDLERNGRPFTLAVVIKIEDHEKHHPYYKILIEASISVPFESGDSLFAVSLFNTTTNNRIWSSLNLRGNSNIIQSVLDTDSLCSSRCNICSDSLPDESSEGVFLQFSELNESQKAAISNSLSLSTCKHKHRVQLVWGPPGTGKTKTISTLLWALVGKKHRTVTCAPTNIAVVQIASRLLHLIKASRGGDFLLGDVVLFGNRQRMKIDQELEKIFLDDRVKKLSKCFCRLSGWSHQLREMIDLLRNPTARYRLFSLQEKEGEKKKPIKFREFIMNRFSSIFQKLKNHLSVFRVHLSTAFISMEKMEETAATFCLLDSFLDLIRVCKIDDTVLQHVLEFPKPEVVLRFLCGYDSAEMEHLSETRLKCFEAMEALKSTFVLPGKNRCKNFCMANATVILCTSVSSFKLRRVKMKPLELCVIDEAAQLKECESLIPLQLPGLRNSILIGDECQLSAMVMSKVSKRAGFGRSLFQRLVSLGHEKELLAVQYRMHPSISLFPNSSFYGDKIQDGENVKCQGFGRRFLDGKIFGPYSFINVPHSAESLNQHRSSKNVFEVAVISEIIRKLFAAWRASKKEVSVGIISPYKAQVAEISEKIGKIYDSSSGFDVNVKTVDGFQGGEEDIIIISTVRANNGGSVGFLSNLQRTNVALTRAKYCLWILGHEPTLVSSGSIWEKVVNDAKNRECFFDADEDESLGKAIVNAKMDLGHFDCLLQPDSLLFRKSKWKVSFAESFKNTFQRTKSAELRKQAVKLLIPLSNGHRPQKIVVLDGSTMELLQLYLIGDHFLFWSVDVQKHSSNNITQVLKFWAFLPRREAPELVQNLEKIFSEYAEDYISRCKIKRIEGGLELPVTWDADEDDDGPEKEEVQGLLKQVMGCRIF
ncbi:hypothetical protein H6P81_018263 [Aristolochia fimbriata]|uniref:Helicase MAGATAMA 3 n=1 Tax=Aristolochia fimbriata TaxID=158543 RepID=A0AAV7E1Q0_ARIFI|nr:hypothetical protein H6P81_018263 [Aristolochia fimbriata]